MPQRPAPTQLSKPVFLLALLSSIVALVSAPAWCGFFAHYRLYSTRHVSTPLHEFQRTLHAVAASVVSMAVISFMGQWYVYRGWLVATFLLALLLLLAVLYAAFRIIRRLRRGRTRRAALS